MAPKGTEGSPSYRRSARALETYIIRNPFGGLQRPLGPALIVEEAVSMTEPSHVWVVCTSMRDLHAWYYVGAETESEARGLVGKKRPGETFIDAKRVKNVEHVKAHELRPVRIGDHWRGPLIPE
jgi:hypothetical protein